MPTSSGTEQNTLRELFVDAIVDYALCATDTDGRIATWSRGAEMLTGYAAVDVVGGPLARLFPESDTVGDKARRQIDLARTAGRCEDEGWRVRKDGTRFWAHSVVTPVTDGTGAVVGFANVFRDLTEQATTTERFRIAIEAAPTGMIMVDPHGDIVLVNLQVERLFGYGRQELIGRSVEMLVPPRARSHHPGFRSAFVGSPSARPMGAGRDLFGLHKDGREVPIEIGLNPFAVDGGVAVLCSIVDITERKRIEREVEEQRVDLEKKHVEREVLLKEVYHRVKNNLQVISSLLRLQSTQLEDERAKELFEESQNRVFSIALVHERLYQSLDLAKVDFDEYAQALVEHLGGMLTGARAIHVVVHRFGQTLPIDRAVPLGLIVNELVTNAFKHAFRERDRGSIEIGLAPDGPGALVLTVRDDGCGLPDGFDLHRPTSLGLDLVVKLGRQIGAVIDLSRTGGTSFALRLDRDRR